MSNVKVTRNENVKIVFCAYLRDFRQTITEAMRRPRCYSLVISDNTAI